MSTIKKKAKKPPVGFDLLTTHKGFKFDPLTFAASDFNIEDMALCLSNKCRFGGHLKKFYSVAEHSVLVSQLLERMYPVHYLLQMAGLLHEVDEYVTTLDIPSPIKPGFSFKRVPIHEIEKRCKSIVCEALKMRLPMHSKDLKLADRILCSSESVALRQIKLSNFPPPQYMEIQSCTPTEAYILFIERFKQLNVRIQSDKRQNTRSKRIRSKSS